MSSVAAAAAHLTLVGRVGCPGAQLDHSFGQLVVPGVGSSVAGSIAGLGIVEVEQGPSGPVGAGSAAAVRRTESFQ